MPRIEETTSYEHPEIDAGAWSESCFMQDTGLTPYEQIQARLERMPPDRLAECKQGKDYPLMKLVVSLGIYHEVLDALLERTPQFQKWDLHQQGAGFVESLENGRPNTEKLALALSDPQNEILTFPSGSTAVWNIPMQAKLAIELAAFQLRTGLLGESPSVAFVHEIGVESAIEQIVSSFQDKHQLFLDQDLQLALSNRIRILTEYSNAIFNEKCPRRITAIISSGISPNSMGGFHGNHSKRLLSIEFGDTTIGIFKPNLSQFVKNTEYSQIRDEQSQLFYKSMADIGRTIVENRSTDYESALRALAHNLELAVAFDYSSSFSRTHIPAEGFQTAPNGLAIVFPKLPTEHTKWNFPKDWLHASPYSSSSRLGIVVDYVL